MSEEQSISVVFWNAETGEEITDLEFRLQFPIHVGDEIHYWQDGIALAAGTDSGIRRDFLVKRVRHDLRYLPSRGGRPMYVQTLELFVEELPEPVKP